MSNGTLGQRKLTMRLKAGERKPQVDDFFVCVGRRRDEWHAVYHVVGVRGGEEVVMWKGVEKRVWRVVVMKASEWDVEQRMSTQGLYLFRWDWVRGKNVSGEAMYPG